LQPERSDGSYKCLLPRASPNIETGSLRVAAHFGWRQLQLGYAQLRRNDATEDGASTERTNQTMKYTRKISCEVALWSLCVFTQRSMYQTFHHDHGSSSATEHCIIINSQCSPKYALFRPGSPSLVLLQRHHPGCSSSSRTYVSLRLLLLLLVLFRLRSTLIASKSRRQSGIVLSV
jgi:hypothetical protein